MRIDLESKMGMRSSLELYALAKALIRLSGGKRVLEMRQVCVMGGARYVVTDREELDTTYIGYRGFMDLETLTKALDVRKHAQADKIARTNLEPICKGIASIPLGPWGHQRSCEVDPDILCEKRYEPEPHDRRAKYCCNIITPGYIGTDISESIQ